MYDRRTLTLLMLLLSISVTVSSAELYNFVILPIRVTWNGAFNEGPKYWSSHVFVSDGFFDFSTEPACVEYSSETFRCSVAIAGKDPTWLPRNALWGRVYQLIATHPLVKSATLRFSLFLDKTDLQVLLTSDLVIVYAGCTVSNKTQRYFLAHVWILKDQLGTLSEGTFSVRPFWKTVGLERLNASPSQPLKISLEGSLWNWLGSQGFSTNESWDIFGNFSEGIEMGIILSNIRPSKAPWTVTVYIGELDVTYYWLDTLVACDQLGMLNRITQLASASRNVLYPHRLHSVACCRGNRIGAPYPGSRKIL
jgi:hypothetical protein